MNFSNPILWQHEAPSIICPTAFLSASLSQRHAMVKHILIQAGLEMQQQKQMWHLRTHIHPTRGSYILPPCRWEAWKGTEVTLMSSPERW